MKVQHNTRKHAKKEWLWKRSILVNLWATPCLSRSFTLHLIVSSYYSTFNLKLLFGLQVVPLIKERDNYAKATCFTLFVSFKFSDI